MSTICACVGNFSREFTCTFNVCTDTLFQSQFQRTHLPEVVFNLWSPYLYHCLSVLALVVRHANDKKQEPSNKVNRHRVRTATAWSKETKILGACYTSNRDIDDTRLKKKINIFFLLMLMLLGFKYNIATAVVCSTCLLDDYKQPFFFSLSLSLYRSISMLFHHIQRIAFKFKSHLSYRSPCKNMQSQKW